MDYLSFQKWYSIMRVFCLRTPNSLSLGWNGKKNFQLNGNNILITMLIIYSIKPIITVLELSYILYGHHNPFLTLKWY